MNKIIIYGDSFGIKNNEICDWPELLEKSLNKCVITNAISGEGPNRTMTKFLTDLSLKKYSNVDNYIILLSDPKRIEFNFLKHPEHAASLYWEVLDDNDLDSHYKIFDYDIKMFSKSIGEYFLYENIKNIMLLKLISESFGIKILVFSCFRLNFNIEKYFGKSHSLDIFDNLDYKKIKTNDFMFFETPISEMVGPHSIGSNNHMSEENNRNFSKLVENLLNNESYDDTWFSKTSYTEPGDDFFIYD